MSRSEFIQAMSSAGVSQDTAEFLHDEIVSYYFPPLTPQPNDRLASEMRIDPEDVEDLALSYCEKLSVPEPSAEHPAVLPQDPSLEELGVWLDQFRAKQRNAKAAGRPTACR
ncbi:MAG TPA: hypothetical protein VGD10_04655 [Allosphingosinicella sp.]|uniref:hypothetical protein n=1 Tax=Allosphingosinicella sp. TaxID=2823234 RepID=UPI002EDA8C3F